MKVLLIGPYKGKDNSGDSFCAPPFGLYRIKFYVESKLDNTVVDVLDPNIKDYKSLQGEYDVIGFSPLHLTFENDLMIFAYFKAKFPKAVFIAGGIEVSFLGEKLFQCALFDIVVLGEGEKTLLRILEVIAAGGAGFENIKSIYWKDKEKIRFNGYGNQLTIGDFQEIYHAYDFSAVPYDKYWLNNARLYEKPNWTEIRTVRAVFSNFCPYRCKFCSSTNFISYSYSGELSGKCHFCMLSVEEVVNILSRIVDAWGEVETVIFDDDNFSLNMQYLKELCLKIIEFKINGELKKDLSFICQARPDVFSKVDREIFSLMKRSGFRMIMYGVESFSDKILQSLGKGVASQQALGVIDSTISAGITPLAYIILFPPLGDKQDLLTTVDLCVQQLSKNLEISTTLLLMDIPGSAFYYDNSLRRVSKQYFIAERVMVEKSDYIWPSNEELFELSKDIFDNYSGYEDDFKRYYRIQHVPSRIYSLIAFDAIYKWFGLDDKRKNFQEIVQKAISNYQ